MGLLTKLGNGLKAFEAAFKNLTPEQAAASIRYLRSMYAYNGMGVSFLSQQNLNYFINRGFEANADVFAVVNWISENAADIPLIVESMDGNQWTPVGKMHPLQKLLDNPNPYQSGQEFRANLFGYYNITGNGLVYGPKIEAGMNRGQLTEMWIMPSQYTEIVSGGWMNPIKGYKINFQGGYENMLPFDDVMHMRTINLSVGAGNEFWGMSPLQAGLLSLNRSNANYVAANKSFENGGPAGVLMEKKGSEFVNDYDPEQISIAQEQFEQNFAGAMKQGRVMLTNKEMGYLSMGLSPVDLNLIMDKRATLRDFCNIYKVSSIIFNDNENSSYNNAEQAIKRAYTDAVLPLVKRYVDEVNKWLTPAYGDDIRVTFDISNITVLQDDLGEMMSWVVNGVNNGIITRNEGREIIKKQPIDESGMDDITVAFNQMPIEGITSDPFIETEDAMKRLGKHYLDK